MIMELRSPAILLVVYLVFHHLDEVYVDYDCVNKDRSCIFLFVTSVRLWFMDTCGFPDEKSEGRLYVGNLDLRITEAALIKMFSPYGRIVSEDFLWHTRGPKRGEPRGYAFIQYNTKEEAKLAKEKMHGRLAYGRPLVVRLASEKLLEDGAQTCFKAASEASKTGVAGSTFGQMNRSAKIAAIKNKLKALEEDKSAAKRQKQGDKISCSSSV